MSGSRRINHMTLNLNLVKLANDTLASSLC